MMSNMQSIKQLVVNCTGLVENAPHHPHPMGFNAVLFCF